MDKSYVPPLVRSVYYLLFEMIIADRDKLVHKTDVTAKSLAQLRMSFKMSGLVKLNDKGRHM